MDFIGILIILGVISGIYTLITESIDDAKAKQESNHYKTQILTKFNESVLIDFNLEREKNGILESLRSVDINNIRHEYEDVVWESKVQANKMNETLNKRCSKCRHKMIVRVNPKTGHKFLGCGQYPRCKFIKQIHE